MIKYNVVTWYSKLLAILIFLLGVPMLAFYIGVQYEKTNSATLSFSSIVPMYEYTTTTSNPVLIMSSMEDRILTNSQTPVIVGGNSNGSGVGIVILSGNQTLPKEGYFDDLPNTVAVDYSDHGGGVETPYRSGVFKYEILKPLKKGVYTIGAYSYGVIPTTPKAENDYASFQMTLPKLIIGNTLIVK